MPQISRTKGQSRATGLLLAGAILFVIILANLPCQYVEVHGRWVGGFEITGTAEYQPYQILPTMAGWPFSYWVQYPLNDGAEDRFWSVPRLLMNAGFGLLLALLVYNFIQWRHRYAVRVSEHRLLFDIGTALAILGVPLLVVGWQFRMASHHERLAQQLSRYGNCYLSCWIPEALVDHVPVSWTKKFVRLRQYASSRDPGPLAKQVLELPTLVSMGCSTGRFDLTHLDKLVDNIHFAGLQLNDYALTDAEMDSISGMRWLITLNLADTNVTAEMLARCQQDRLRFVDLTNADLRLADLGEPAWKSSVEVLYLPRSSRRGDQLTLRGWPKLRQLMVKRLTSRTNEQVLDVRITDLPQLEILGLNRLQKHRLVLRNVPRLRSVEDSVAELRFVLNSEQFVPGMTWVSDVEIDGANSLTSIRCFARDLESLQVKDAPSLRSIGIGSFLTTWLGRIRLQAADPALCQGWIDQLGNRQGPGIVDFTGLPLSQVDLTPLASNRRIRHLRFGASDITFEQLTCLEEMEQLESLDLRSCRLEEDQLSWVLERFPNLSELIVNGSQLTRVDLTSDTRLESLHTNRLEKVERLRIVDLPQLQAALRLSKAPKQLEIRNAKSLLGLAVEDAWPSTAKVSGLRDLQWFAAGGAAVDDALLDALLDCRNLDQLILAYPGASPDRLAKLGGLRGLTFLAVPGANINDEVTDQWHSLKSIRELNLDDTNVSVKTVAWLATIESLRSVSLNRVPLNAAARDAISELRQLSELNLADVPVDSSVLKPVFSAGNLELLDLSGQTLDEPFVDILCKAFSLTNLVIHDCDIDDASIVRLVEANKSLVIDLGPTRPFPSEEIALELGRRAAAVRDYAMNTWRDDTRMNDSITFAGMGDGEGEVGERVDLDEASIVNVAGRIDPQSYRPIE